MTLGERYEVHSRLGEGGMAIVYRATDRRLGREVAVKMLRPQYADDADFVARFQAEARAAAQLTHPNIAAVFDTGQDGRHYYIVMELLRPFTLRDLISRSENGKLDPHQAVTFAAEIAAALHFAHQHGVIHRDVKPQNVLFTDDGHVKVTDFGIAKALSAAGGTATGTILGSPHYLSPEQAGGHTVGPASDVYSLGVVLYEMLTGRPPYTGETPVAIAVQHLRGIPTPIRELAPDVPEPVAAVVERAMARRPEQRFASAAELREALLAALAGKSPALAATTVMPREAIQAAVPPASELPPVDYEPPPRRGSLSPLAAAGLTALLMACVALGIVLALRAPSDNGGETTTNGQPTPAPKIVVEDLVGQDVDAARARLRSKYGALGIEPPQLVEVARENNEAPRNQILSQDPPAGVAIDPGGVIRVRVSSGVTEVTVPDLLGLTLDRARELLTTKNLSVGRLSKEHSDLYPSETVCSQSRSPGTPVLEGSEVDLVLSLGPEPPPPTEPTPPDTPPSGGEATVAVSGPDTIDDGLPLATIVVDVPSDGTSAQVSLKWLSGGTGEEAGAVVEPGDSWTQEVRGSAGAVLGVYVNDKLLRRVQY